jgi:hypothetical protein
MTEVNLLQMGGSMRGFGLVCQGQTRHSMLRAGGFPWTRAFRAGKVRCECKGDQPSDLLRDGVLSEKRRRSPSRRHLDFYFLAHGRSSAGYLSAPVCAVHADRCGHAQAGMGST